MAGSIQHSGGGEGGPGGGAAAPAAILPVTAVVPAPDDDDDDRALLREMKQNLKFLYRRKPRKYQRDEFVDMHITDLDNMFMAIRDYLNTLAVPLLQLMDFHTFCNFCFLYSDKSR
jgi:hypothetical protein